MYITCSPITRHLNGTKAVGYVSLRYTILANHHLACYLGVICTRSVEIIHKVIAIILAAIYVLILTGNFEYYSGFNNAQGVINGLDMPHKADRGVAVIYFLAGFSCYSLMFPEHASNKFSPRVGGLQEKILQPSFWLVVGYFCMLTFFIVLEVFK